MGIVLFFNMLNVIDCNSFCAKLCHQYVYCWNCNVLYCVFSMCTMRVCMLQGWFYDNKCIHPTRVTNTISNPQHWNEVSGIMSSLVPSTRACVGTGAGLELAGASDHSHVSNGASVVANRCPDIIGEALLLMPGSFSSCHGLYVV